MRYSFSTIIFFSAFAVMIASCSMERVLRKAEVTIHSIHQVDCKGLAIIAGTAVDTVGQRIVDLEISIYDADTHIFIARTSANKNSTYELTNIPPGKYTIFAWMLGYKKAMLNNFVIQPNTVNIIDFSMTPIPVDVKEVI